MRRSLLALAWFAAGPVDLARAADQATSCIACHAGKVNLDEDVHLRVGLSCHDCHGGNPSPAMAEDRAAAEDPGFAPSPFVGVPARERVPAFCGRCHSDAQRMKRYKPDARIDQEREYATSKHGQLLQQGDRNVATCVDCHGGHGIRPPIDAKSPVHPTRVAETCDRCHGDPKRMAPYVLPDGRPLPIDQYRRWRQSVHAAALMEREDLSAPTCNDCHGNHGAVPPGVDAVVFVCGQCHAREADLFRKSPKAEGFHDHNSDYLTQQEGCGGDCHAAPDPAASITTIPSFGECITCHENHAVMRPTMALLGPLPEHPCALCHEMPAGAARERRHDRYLAVRDGLLAEARRQELGRDQLFDWMLDQAQSLPAHTLEGEGKAEPRPEWARLLAKFRIGKTSAIYRDPESGGQVVQRIAGCARCHAAKPTLADRPAGLETARAMVDGMAELIGTTSWAERVLLRARRGGVEVRKGTMEIDKAVDAQIELEVLVHTFSAEAASPFAAKQAEGLSHAKAALDAGDAAMAELSYRRRGLMLALAIIAMVLVGLALKIRQL